MSIQKAGLLLLAAVCASQAQGPDSVRRATINGSRGTSGKCTIEVRVDIAAEVDISGDSGRLRTIAGQPATWTRMECSDPLPSQMSDFRFKGVDGRGQMRLVQDPRNNNSVAVIRIDDPKSGSEGYTFDIEWSGGGGDGRGDDRRGGGDDRNFNRDRGRDGGRDRYTTVSCNSNDERRHYCDADTSQGVRLLKQNSGSPCDQGRSWGYDRRGIWVDRGCRADFEVKVR